MPRGPCVARTVATSETRGRFFAVVAEEWTFCAGVILLPWHGDLHRDRQSVSAEARWRRRAYGSVGKKALSESASKPMVLPRALRSPTPSSHHHHGHPDASIDHPIGPPFVEGRDTGSTRREESGTTHPRFLSPKAYVLSTAYETPSHERMFRGDVCEDPTPCRRRASFGRRALLALPGSERRGWVDGKRQTADDGRSGKECMGTSCCDADCIGVRSLRVASRVSGCSVSVQ